MESPCAINGLESASFGNDTLAALCQLESDLQPCSSKGVDNNASDQSSQTLTNVSEHQDVNASEYTSPHNKTTQSNITFLSTQEKQDLKSWGLPEAVLKEYHSAGVKSMFSWQVECLCSPNVLDGGNLVYSAPTSAGKTLVAEILAIKTVLERKKKVIIILPFVSVVREKMFYFQDLLGSSGVRVEGLMGSHRIFGGFKKIQIAICTIEKANSLINRLLEDGQIKDLGAVVVDELHLVGDPFRGYLLELLLTKIQYMNTREKGVSIQIVGMSATLPNLDLLAKWLKAGLYRTDFRPVPLQEFLKVESLIYDKTLKVHRVLQPEVIIQDDSDHVIYLCLETLFAGHSVLIFCPTKNWCESLAQHIAKEFQTLGNSKHDLGCKLRSQLNTSAIVEALEQLKRCPVGLDTVLRKTVSFGVAFHHAGLTLDERDIIEGLFRGGVIRVLVATSTLSSGVNLPARRVIIRSPLFCGEAIGIQTYRQMIGRAGRLGKDTEGESFLVCTKSEKRIGEKLIRSDLQPIESCLGFGELSASLKRAVLEIIASGVATTPEQIDIYMNCTLLAASNSVSENPIKACIKFLKENELIRLQNKDDKTQYVPTPLGAACLAASIPPDDGLELFRELQRARQCFVLENDLHLVYQVTPLNIAAQWGNLDWFQVMTLWEQLPTSMRRVGELVGIEEVFMVKALRGTVNLQSKKEIGRINLRKMAIHRRFYTALALQDLINEVPLTEVANKFKCSKGMLQSLQQSASTYAGMVTAFCKRLGWDNMELLFSQFQDRLQFGIHRELCDLMRLDLLNGLRARALFNAGITSLASLAAADVCEVENALHAAIPFQSSKELDGESSFETAKRNEMKSVWITGRRGLTEREAATLLIKEARFMLQKELGLADAKWEMVGEASDSSGYTSSSSTSSHESSAEHSHILDEIVECHATTQMTSDESVKIRANEKNKNSSHFCEPVSLSSNETKKQIINIAGNSLLTERKEISDSPCVSKCGTSAPGPFEIHYKTHKDDLNDSLHQGTPDKCVIKETENATGLCDMAQPIPKMDHGLDLSTSERSAFEQVDDAIVKDHSKTVIDSSIEDLLHERPTSSRNSSDFFASPSSENNYRSPSLFGDSFSINTQLEDVLDCNISPVNTTKVAAHVYNLRKRESEKTNIPFSPKQDSADNFSINTQLADVLDCKISPLNGAKTPLPLFNLKERGDCMKTNMHSSPKQDCTSSLIVNTPLGDVLDCNISSATETPRQVCNSQRSGECGKTTLLLSPKQNFPLSVEQHDDKQAALLTEHTNTKSETIGFADDSVITDSFLENAFRTYLPLNSEVVSPSDSEKSESTSRKKSKFSTVGLKTPNAKPIKDRKLTLSKKKRKNHENATDVELMKSLVSPSKKIRLCTGINSEKSPQILLATHNKTPARLSNVSFDTPADHVSKNLKARKLRFSKVTVFHSSSEEEGEEDEENNETNVLARSSQKSTVQSFSLRSKMAPVSMKFNTPCKSSAQNAGEISEPGRKLDVESGSEKQLTSAISEEKDGKQRMVQLTPPVNCNLSGDTTDCIDIINVSGHADIFSTFKSELQHVKHFSISLACDKYETEKQTAIGNKILGRKRKKVEGDKSSQFVHGERHAVGIAICCGGYNVYYISLLDEGNSSDAIPVQERILLLKEMLTNSTCQKSVSVFDGKEMYKALYNCLGIRLHGLTCDPKIADWLLNPEGREKNLQAMAIHYCPEVSQVAVLVGPIRGVGSPALNISSSVSAQLRSSAEALVTWHTVNAQFKLLSENKLLQVFEEVEMPTLLCLARMELSGIGFSINEAERLRNVLLSQMSSFENKAYKLAGHTFSLTSPADVSKVLFKELGLNPGKTPYGQKPSTNKDALLPLKQYHPLPEVILQWRKINTILTKTLYPLLNSDSAKRIFGCYIPRTATGRISMHEPNMQNIPRDFDVSGCDGENLSISMRLAFIPKPGNVFLSADYSQLELRILAHLSGDHILLDILNSDKDVFRGIASIWNKIPESEVTDKLRQHAKQVCYGMIYGIGSKALGEQLEVNETQAAEFMETFKRAYPGVRKYVEDTIKKCRAKGYIETLHGRKRFLPAINSPNQIIRAHAERQAVNSTIQGSAADVAKKGMVLVESRLAASLSHNPSVVTRAQDQRTNKLSVTAPKAELILHLHDELLYEVSKGELQKVAQIVKSGMESAAILSVKLPVKIKTGNSWGSLKDMEI
ncbi:DNA polymerase theta [Schistocerca piceifrons]|uniref:DNA polymerase theta n=1 Tax=Schistocerca piceifrons TaxID=274613 RepID=UPI001F5ED2ED|nr:DNA polymerase theta [Schistocerca piceifrons]